MSRSGMTRAAWVALVGLGVGCAPQEDVDRGRELDDPGTRIRQILERAEAPVLPSPDGDTVHVSEAVRAFYEGRDYEPAWTDEDGFRPAAGALVDLLGRADDEGLDPARYPMAAVHSVLRRARADHAQALQVGDALGTADMILTEALLRFSTDLVRGGVDPDSSGIPWRIPRGDLPDEAVLAELVAHPELGDAVDSLRPTSPFYRNLRAARARYERVVAEGGWPAVSRGETLEEGSRGARVVEVRRRLAAEGDSTEAALVAGAPEPELFDARLAQAVTHFQERHGIAPDGTVGGETLKELNVGAEERLMAILLNLDRWRWLPRDLGERYVLVNVAAFEMAVMEKDEPVLRMNVVVGKDGNNTPFFQDTLEYVVVNPYWNVPPGILEKEILPAVQRDPGYLARNGYERTADGGVRQRPGAGNALGHVKFLFPNDMNIYLHDTPARHLFSRPQRAFSHGCIRVEKPDELASYLLRTATSRGEDNYAALRATGREQWVELDAKLPVYILYFTAWADGDGTVRFYRDVYERDQAISDVARIALAPRPTAPVTDVPLAAGDLTGH